MKCKKILIACTCGVLLQGCVYRNIYNAMTDKGDFFPVKTVEVNYKPENQARIRVLNGYITNDSQCYRPNPNWGKAALDNLKSAYALTTGVVAESTSIGMPRSSQKNRSQFTEEVITADHPVSVRARIDQTSIDPTTKIETRVKCDPPAVSFMPEKGRDYVTALVSSGDKCWIDVKLLGPDGMELETPKVNMALAPACP
jgi:hypothetical protein